jgi:hypothetical protein
MAGGLTIFAGHQTEVIRWLVGAKPIADQPLRARFDRLAAAAGLPSPHFELIDLTGGSFANALALASLERGAVVFTSPLLERLDPDETDAICAHELAHLEYHNTRRLRRQRRICRSLVVGGAVLTPVVKLLVPSVLWLACTAWPLVVLIAIAVLVHDRQKHETASDLRACALTGNPRTLKVPCIDGSSCAIHTGNPYTFMFAAPLCQVDSCQNSTALPISSPPSRRSIAKTNRKATPPHLNSAKDFRRPTVRVTTSTTSSN